MIIYHRFSCNFHDLLNASSLEDRSISISDFDVKICRSESHLPLRPSPQQDHSLSLSLAHRGAIIPEAVKKRKKNKKKGQASDKRSLVNSLKRQCTVSVGCRWWQGGATDDRDGEEEIRKRGGLEEEKIRKEGRGSNRGRDRVLFSRSLCRVH